jgi:hypothetical protein
MKKEILELHVAKSDMVVLLQILCVMTSFILRQQVTTLYYMAKEESHNIWSTSSSSRTQQDPANGDNWDSRTTLMQHVILS